ncbi:MAG: hypothetical protein IPK37_13130 [Austwickia sp.]|nr:MAG: hypothetical protein IPK37_13130 [Austwickia sp.]
MSWLALWFLALACLDLARGAPGRRTPLTVGGVVAVAMWLLTGRTTVADLLALGVALASLWAWLAASQAALSGSQERPPGVRRAVATLVVPAALATLCAGWAHPIDGPLVAWLGWAHPPLLAALSPERAVAALAAILAQWGTGNVVVRLVLAGTGVPRTSDGEEFTAEQRLKGGRLLGPMERTFILGLGLVGQLPAAAVISAAKGLLRFPELQAVHRESLLGPAGTPVRPPPGPQRIDTATEYFLVGTFTSWLFAVVCLVCLR